MTLALKTKATNATERVKTIHVIDADINAHRAAFWADHARAGQRQKQTLVEAKRIYVAISGKAWEPKASTNFMSDIPGAVRGWYHRNSFELFAQYTWGEA